MQSYNPYDGQSYLPTPHVRKWSGGIPGINNFLFSLIVSSVPKFLLFFFLGLHLWHMEVPGLGVEMQLELPACATASATLDLCCSLWKCWILNPLSQARD